MDKAKKIIKKKGGKVNDNVVVDTIEKVTNNIIEDKIDIIKKKDSKKNDIITEIIIDKEYVNKLHTGFVNTVLDTSVLLHPRDMNNNMYIYIKNELIKQHEKKCFKTYGYIKKIYKIDNIKEELIDMENSECSQRYVLTFSCKIYKPIMHRELICKMDKITEKISTAVNGPMKIIITPNRLNRDKFYTGTSDMVIRLINTGEILTQNHYVKIYIEGITFADKDELIIIIGFLIDIAKPDEIKNFYDIGEIEETYIGDF
jgi:DNA-directed RNA polymerase subunit E'/Rpb7